MNIKVTSDSTCDLPKELLEQYNIDLVPLIIMKDEEEFLDNVTITPNDFIIISAMPAEISAPPLPEALPFTRSCLPSTPRTTTA